MKNRDNKTLFANILKQKVTEMKNINKKDNNTGVLKKTAVFGILLLFTISAIMAFEITKATDDVIWEVTLDLKEPDGAIDYIVFGEAHDANDGLPVDSYDEPKPPAPKEPYIRAWFNDNLAEPYNILLKDYREHPDTYKVWNLSIQWTPSDYVTSTFVTTSWNISELDDSMYASMILCDHEGNLLKNMTTQNNYSFTCPANIVQQFQIICQSGTSNGTTNANETPFLPLTLVFALIILVLSILYWKKTRR